MDNDTIRWQSPEYKYSVKSPEWFWVFGIISFALVIVSIIIGQITLAIIIIIGGFALLIYAARKPLEIEIEVNSKGVLIGKNFYPFKNLESFGIEEYDDHAKLLLESKKTMMPLISVIINEDQVDIEDLKEHLENYLREEEHSDSLTYKIAEKLGF